MRRQMNLMPQARRKVMHHHHVKLTGERILNSVLGVLMGMLALTLLLGLGLRLVPTWFSIEDVSNQEMALINRLADTDLEFQKLHNQLTSVSEKENKRIRWSEALNDVLGTVPRGMILESLLVDEGRVQITGVASNRIQLATWKDTLETLENVESVELPLENLRLRDQNRFELAISLL